MTINYPKVIITPFPNIDDEEVLYWTHRMNLLRIVLFKLYEKLYGYNQNFKLSIGLLASIIKRQIEISNSIYFLITKGMIRDVGILLLSFYELTLDLQYMATNPDAINEWFAHKNQDYKPWSMKKKIEIVFPSINERKSEEKFYRKFCMIKHGNALARHDAFDSFIWEDKLVISELKVGMVIPNLYAIGYLIRRTFDATLKILSNYEVIEQELQNEMNVLFNDFDNDFKILFQLRLIEHKFPKDINKQQKLVDKMGLHFSKYNG